MALEDSDLLAVYRSSDDKNYKTTVSALVGRLPSPPVVNNGTITLKAAGSLTGGGEFTLNQAADKTITLTGPDVSDFLSEPTANGSFVIVESDDGASYSSTIDGGEYGYDD